MHETLMIAKHETCIDFYGASERLMVLGDRDLLLILAFFTIVMYGESRGN